MNFYLKAYSGGLIILVVAILANIIAVKLNCSTWFSFIDKINEKGFSKAFSEQSLGSLLFLFLIYPFLLGIFVLLFFNYLK